MSSTDWTTIPQHDLIPSYSAFTKAIEKSQLDQREYRLIRLNNDLTAMLVHDPHTENAAASLDVAVGHLSDPVSNTLIQYCFLTSLPSLGRHAGFGSLLRAPVIHGMQTDDPVTWL